MPKRIILFAAVSTLAITALGQLTMTPSVVAAGGNEHHGEAFSISWTLGDLAISTLSGENLILTQGFHQPMGRGTGITGKKFRGSILVYPNPVKDDLFIRFETLTPGDFLLEIQDMTGRILMQRSYKQVAPGDILRVTSLPQAPGIYFLKLTGPGKEDPFVTLIRKTM